jgi:hypothetical protein
LSEVTRRGFLLAALPLWLGAAYRKVELAGVPIEVLKNGRSKRRYLLIHGNEQTAREVLQAHMKTHKGIAHLVTGKQRNIPVEGGVLDPNRMFSRVGAEKNLKTLNPSFTAAQVNTVLARLDKRRGQLVKALLPPSGGLLVAVHNNSQGYSVEAEVPISDQVALNDKKNPHEFFLTVQEPDYRLLAKSPYNVVLQNKVPPDDDGSLSRLAAKQRVRYVNLEVALGKSQKQKEMLEWLERNLP